MFYLIITTLFVLVSRGNGGISELTMKAVVVNSFGPPDVLQLQDVPIPKISPNQILVKVKAAGINPIDAYLRNGTHFTKPDLPIVLGKEIAGIVEDVDESVSDFKKDDRVFCGVDYGGYAEYAVANVNNCYPLTDRIMFEEGAAVYVTYFTAYRGLAIRGRMEKNDTILIHGASGSLGFASIQIAKAVGTYVVATVGDQDAEKVASAAGADLVVYHNKKNYLADTLEHLHKPGFDVIFEIIAKLNLQRDKQYLASYGRIVVVGNRVCLREVGPPIYSVSLFKFNEKDQNEAACFILQQIENGWIVPLVRKVYSLEQVRTAHRDVIGSEGTRGKLIFTL